MLTTIHVTTRLKGFELWINPVINEYIAVYVDDLCIAAENPKEFVNILKSK